MLDKADACLSYRKDGGGEDMSDEDFAEIRRVIVCVVGAVGLRHCDGDEDVCGGRERGGKRGCLSSGRGGDMLGGNLRLRWSTACLFSRGFGRMG